MIRSHRALLRQAQAFFLSDMVGVFDWGEVQVAPPELMPPEQRRDAGVGKFREMERLSFGPWEILLCSSHEKPPLGEVSLREGGFSAGPLIVGPLDPATWRRIGEYIRSVTSHQRKAS